MKKQKPEQQKPAVSAQIEGAGEVSEKNIVETLQENYLPYAMSVIVSRALPEIDGFKPSHRKLLYTMYKMGLLTGARTKSANIVGQTMRLNPHGDAAIYETMVRLARGNEALLHPFVDSKGNFGKAYSRDMAYAAARYTEAKLEPVCAELFSEIERDTVDFTPNYDATMNEPVLLPVKFPSILVNSNIGIAVSMASNICPFNLSEVCETAIALMKDPEHDIISTLKAPDFPGGGLIIYDEEEMGGIYATGRGSVKVRSRYRFDKSENCVEITEIPPTTTVEAIIDKIVEHVKAGKIKEINDTRDETDLSGLKLTLDLKRGVNPDELMRKLFRLTPLQDVFSCNFNLLIGGNPRVMGVGEILSEWVAFRGECVRRRVLFDMNKRKEKLHLLVGLRKILLDIDKAVRIVRETDEESEVVPNLMIGFGIDEAQADYVAEIRLRHINREYILKRTAEIEELRKAVAEAEEILSSDRKIKAVIISDLKEISAKYGKPRRSELIFRREQDDEAAVQIAEAVPDYAVNVFITKEGYFKKITPLSLRMGGEHKLKEGDAIIARCDACNRDELLFFTDRGTAYKSRLSDFEDVKAGVMGDYIPSKLDFEEGERLVFTAVTSDYSETIVSFFKNGKCAKVPLSSFETKTKRKKLANSLNTDSPVVAMFKITDDREFLLRSEAGKVMIFSSALVLPKSARNTRGVQVMRLTKTALGSASLYGDKVIENKEKYVTKTIPSAGAAGNVQLKIDACEN
ncbi:MAG: topoisomerase IV [Oscillospiraceae bacterium]|jgi:DNA gyrase subunit A|nr:topoisomerase IV [Oscillospiraceae bacterium]